MTTDSQPQSNVKTQTNLSAAQVKALADAMSNEQKILLRSIERLNNAELKLTNRYHKKVALAMTLHALNLVDLWNEAFPIKKSVFAMNDLGWAVWHYIVNGTLPEAEPAVPVIDETQSQSNAMAASTPTTNVKKIMTAAQIAFYTGKRIDTVKWALPEGYGICTITHKMLPESELMVTFAHHHFTDEQLAQLGHWGEGWCECAEWLSEDGYHQIMARVEACGLKDVYEAGYWGPAPVVATAEGTESAPVIAQSAPVETPVIDETPASPAPRYEVDDEVKFNYFRDPIYKHEVYTGKIEQRKYDRLSGWMYRIDPAPCEFNLTPRWIAERYVRGLVGMVEDLFALGSAVDAAYVAYDYAHQYGAAPEDVNALSEEFATLHEAFMDRMGFPQSFRALYRDKKRPQTGKEGVSSASPVSRVEMDAAPAEIASTRDCEDDFIPVSTDTSIHPLRLAQPGSIAAKLPDTETLKAKRNQQYAEAKARIEAVNGVYQAPVRQAIQMHSASDLRAMFAAMDGAS